MENINQKNTGIFVRVLGTLLCALVLGIIFDVAQRIVAADKLMIWLLVSIPIIIYTVVIYLNGKRVDPKWGFSVFLKPSVSVYGIMLLIFASAAIIALASGLPLISSFGITLESGVLLIMWTRREKS